MNLNTHPGFTELTESERYWAGYLNRIAEQNDWSNPEEMAGQSFTLFKLGERINLSNQWDGWLVETLLSALILEDQGTAFKALLQAIRYDALAEVNNRLRYPDALLTAKQRITKWVE